MFVKLEWNASKLGRVEGVKKSNRGVNLIKIQDIHRWNTPFNNEYEVKRYGGWVLGKGKGEYRGKYRANVIETVYIVAWKEINKHVAIILSRGSRGENDDVDESNHDTLHHNKIPCRTHIC
jgi:hypothetical protein